MQEGRHLAAPLIASFGSKSRGVQSCYVQVIGTRYLSWATVAWKSWPRIAPLGKALLWTLT
jgi:hypothetical protein